jgi:osmotically-inducible protein OsmY
MLTSTLSRADIKAREDVVHQLEWDPEVDASSIGVTADDGAVTLSGFIDSYTGKLAAERAAKRVRGVRAVANELEVRLKLERADDDIARDAAQALSMHHDVPETVQAAVHHGHVTLTGQVPWLVPSRDVGARRARHQGGGARRQPDHRTAAGGVQGCASPDH